MTLTKPIRDKILSFQRNEITEHHIYRKLASVEKDPRNQEVLLKIADDELRHYHLWRELTQEDVKPDNLKTRFYYFFIRVFGLTFGIKKMELGEEGAQENYAQLRGEIDNIEMFIEEENAHEQALIGLIDEERLRYVGSIVLGLNDALVELTGALAGLTLALQNTKLIALTGLITGVAAAMSMAASEYLSTKSETTEKNPVRASIYTGMAYIVTVIILILPYLIISNYFLCLIFTLAFALIIIAFFNYYVSVVREESFPRRFAEMAGLSLGVATLSFFLGYLIRTFLGVEI
jgi:VIT1/CCC1 family predicted Fe2+/Mn2+ transporter